MKVLMKVIGSLILSVIILFQTNLLGDVGGLSSSNQMDRGANIQIIVSGYDGISGTVRFDQPDVEELDTPEGLFSLLRLPRTVLSSEIGKPELPVLRRMVQIPSGAEPGLILSSMDGRTVSMEEIGAAYPVFPVQPPVPKVKRAFDQLKFEIDEGFYHSDQFYPEKVAQIVETGIIRGHTYAIVEFYPVRYNPVRKEFQILSSASFLITLEGSNPVRTEMDLDRYDSPPFEKILSEMLVNYDTFHTEERSGLRPPLGFLVIVPDSYFDYALAYSDWKVQKGLHTAVAPLSETGDTRDEIYAYILDAYLNWEVPPTYILLFGDTNLIPCYDGSAGNHATDLKYVSVVGGDWLPDMIIGRFPFRTSEQLLTMIEKNLDYETLDLPSTDFMNNACFIASDDPWFWNVAEDTHRYVIQNYMRPNGIFATPIRGHFGGNTQDITNAVDGGQTFVNYSGHGSTVSWGGPSFNQNNVRSLTNQDMYPFVISHACVTGSYDLTECFGETWVREPDKGGLAFWGASNNTYWDEDDFLERRMYDVNFLRSYTTIGEQTYAALYWMNFAGWGMSQYYFEAYNILGDPTIDIFMGHPYTPGITYPGTISVGPQDFTVEVLDGGEGVEDALVCIMKNGDLYETGCTDSDGVITFSIDPSSGGTLDVTVTGHNMAPHEGAVTVLTIME
jgi:hypothetical protein